MTTVSAVKHMVDEASTRAGFAPAVDAAAEDAAEDAAIRDMPVAVAGPAAGYPVSKQRLFSSQRCGASYTRT